MRILTVIIGVLAIASTAIAAPLNYGYGFEAPGGNDSWNLDWYNPPSVGGSMHARQLAGAKNGTYGIKALASVVQASSVDLARGAARDGYMQPGEVVVPTESDSIIVSSWVALGHEKLAAAMIELSYGEDANSHAPINSSLTDYLGDPAPYPAPLASPIGCIALANARCVGIKAYDQIAIFNGTQWVDTGIAYPDQRGKWNVWQMEIAPDVGGVQVRVNVGNGAGWSSWVSAPGVTQFDHVSYRQHYDAAKMYYADDIAVTGGNVVPEPTALALLGLGLPLVVRRRRR